MFFIYDCDCSESYFFFFQAEDGIRDLVRSRGLGDVYKRQAHTCNSADDIFHISADSKYVICTKKANTADI